MENIYKNIKDFTIVKSKPISESTKFSTLVGEVGTYDKFDILEWNLAMLK